MNSEDGAFQPRWFVIAVLAAILLGIAIAVWLYSSLATG